MTSDEADQRILVSRRTLASYIRMIEGDELPLSDLGLFKEEIVVLGGIGAAHPSKAAELIVLVEEWIKLRERLMRKLH